MLFLVRFPSQRSGTPYYPNLDSIATCPPPSLPQLSSTQQPLPPRLRCHSPGGGETGLFLPLCVHALAGWLAGRLAVGDKRTLLLRPVAQPRQSLYYIHRGRSAVNRDERGKRSDNCCFFFFEAPTTHAGSFSGVIVLGRGHGRSSLGHCREPQMRAASICPTRATALRLWGLVMFDFDSFRRGSTCAPRYDACRHLYPPHRWTTRGCVRSWLYSDLCLPSHMVGSSLPRKNENDFAHRGTVN